LADTRSRRQKLEAVLAPNSGATEGEKANARALLEKITDKPPEDAFVGLRDFLNSKQATEPAHTKPGGTFTTGYDFSDYDRAFRNARTEKRTYAETIHQFYDAMDRQARYAEQRQSDFKADNEGSTGAHVHDWFEIGQDMYGGSISACICGAYKPARR
jgi:hypothetical protein